jgi:1-deoxy-D-xylulose-5-phosphate reductoisomerase
VVKSIALLGSTGSIGRNAIEVAGNLEGECRIDLLAASKSVDALAEQIRSVRPKVAVITDESLLGALMAKAGGTDCEILGGADALESLIRSRKFDIVFHAISGGVGLRYSVAAIEAGSALALANKESLVTAGHLLIEMAREKRVNILPVDSEHSAILQSIADNDRGAIKRVIITASGGPFYGYTREQLEKVTPAQALNHPTWKMGRKITIDSATLMNKALEIIEAKWLFGLEASQIEVLVHRQSVVHSLVEFCDNSVIAQMGVPDMRIPIQYALTYPKRRRGATAALDLSAVGTLTFEKPDVERFPALRLGFEVARRGGNAGAALNAANEVAVAAFLAGKIPFTRIASVVEEMLERARTIESPSLEQIYATDSTTRKETEQCLYIQ